MHAGRLPRPYYYQWMHAGRLADACVLFEANEQGSVGAESHTKKDPRTHTHTEREREREREREACDT